MDVPISDNPLTIASLNGILSYGRITWHSSQLQQIGTNLSHDGLNPAHVPL